MKTKIILASASPRRKELLKKIVKNFRIIPSQVNESDIATPSPSLLAIKIAVLKAKDVAAKNKKAVVIGADTIVVLGRKILGKPKNKKDAVAMLKSLSGKTHKVITGLAIIFPNHKMITSATETSVRMKKISGKAILDYVKTGSPMDKAGAYGIQEIEEAFIDKISGDYDNVVGLPVRKLQAIIAREENNA